MDTFVSARLAAEIPPERAVATTISRDAILEAIEEDSLPELLLDVTRAGADGSEESGRISITWSRDELEQLLEHAPSERVTLTFDGGELGAAFDDVEAHGIRERAALVSVAAAAALATTGGVAAAMPDPGGTGPLTAPAASVSDATVTDVSSGGGYAAATAADTTVTDVSSGGGYAAPAAATAADTALTDVSSGGGYTPADTGLAASVTDASSGGGYPQAQPVSGGSGGFAIQAPSPTQGGIAGALALTIAAAAFAASRRGKTIKPA